MKKLLSRLFRRRPKPPAPIGVLRFQADGPDGPKHNVYGFRDTPKQNPVQPRIRT